MTTEIKDQSNCMFRAANFRCKALNDEVVDKGARYRIMDYCALGICAFYKPYMGKEVEAEMKRDLGLYPIFKDELPEERCKWYEWKEWQLNQIKK